MPVYTVHEPPHRDSDDDMIAHTSRFRFVRDGFHFWAFLLAPFWMLRHRMWLECIAYLLLVGGITFALHRLGIEETAGAWVALLFAILIGMEAPSVLRWKLARRGFENLGVVVADDLEMAERRFFDRWAANPDAGPSLITPPPPPFGRPAGAAPSEIVGLFPQPEARS
jgi:Protein of unknown function (DUF2628)